MKKIGIFLFVCTIFSFLTTFAQEAITITTYYPAPFGVYTEMRAKRMAIGDVWFDPAQRPWNTPGDPLAWNEIPDHADLVVRGNIGIGTWQPRTRLEIWKGAVRINSPHSQDADGNTVHGMTLNLVESETGTGGWARAFNFTYENDTAGTPPENRFALGAWIRGTSGARALRYGWLGTDHTDPWMMLTPDGRVGIGVPSDQFPEAALDVRGDALIAPRAASNPTSPLNGMTYYNTGSNEFLFRENNVWRTLGGGELYSYNTSIGASASAPTHRDGLILMTGRVAMPDSCEDRWCSISWTNTPFTNIYGVFISGENHRSDVLGQVINTSSINIMIDDEDQNYVNYLIVGN